MTVLNETQKMLQKALEDERLLVKLLDDIEISDAILGFHAQQSVEKLFKALLFKLGTEFPRTHDLGFLYELISKQGLSLPISIDELEGLTTYAVTWRYDEPSFSTMERIQMLSLVTAVKLWVHEEVLK